MRTSVTSYSTVIIACCFCLQAVGIGVYIAFGVFFTPLTVEFGWTRAATSGASALAFFISGLFGIFVGRLNDRSGPRTILMITALFFSMGCMMMAAMSRLWHLYLFFGIVFGLGLSPVDVIALTTVARWFPEKRGIMTGIVKVGTGAGQLIFPLTASFLIAEYGWRRACIVLGAVSLLLLLIISLLIRKQPDQNRSHPVNVLPAAGSGSDDYSFSQAAGTVQFWLVCLINFTVLSCLLSVLVHIVPHARGLGITAHKAAGVLSAIGGASMAGRFITGFVIDRTDSRRSMMTALIILLISMVWLKSADQLWKLYLFAIVYGFAHGGMFTVISPLVAELFGTASHGALFGMVVFFGTAGGAAGPIITGYLFDISSTYNIPIWLALGVSLAAIIFLSFLKPVRPRVSPG